MVKESKSFIYVGSPKEELDRLYAEGWVLVTTTPIIAVSATEERVANMLKNFGMGFSLPPMGSNSFLYVYMNEYFLHRDKE